MKNKKGQNLQLYGIIAGVLLLVVSIFAFSGSNGGSVDIWKESTTLTPYTSQGGDEGEGYYDKESSFNDINVTNGVYNVSKDSQGDFIFERIDNNQTTTSNATENMLKSVIELGENQEIVNVWINSTMNVGGFDKYFEAVLVYDNAWQKYNLLYRVEDEKFIIPNLNKITDSSEVLTDSNAHPNQMLLSMITGSTGGSSGSGNIVDEWSVAYYSGDMNSKYGLVSIVNYNPNTHEIFIQKDLMGRSCSSAGFDYYSVRGISNTQFNKQYNRNYAYYCEGLSQPRYQFSIGELQKYSYDSIALTTETRSIGFDKLSFVKQENTQGTSSFSEKAVRILSSEDFAEMSEFNAGVFTEFMDYGISDLIETSNIDNGIVVNGEDKFQIASNVQGVVVENGVMNLQNGDIITTTQLNFNPENSQGLVMDDLGTTEVLASQMEGFEFGNLKGGFNASFSGTGYFVEQSFWSQATGVVWNLLTFDFDGVSQFWTNTYSNPTISDDVELGSSGGDTFGFTNTFKTSGSEKLTINSEKPLIELLTFEGQDYWLFYTLENTQGGESCLIFDMLNTNLNERIPVSICDEIVAGSNSASLFNINS